MLKIIIKLIWIVLTISTLNACGLIECVDHQIKRDAIALDGESIFKLTLPDGTSKSQLIKCEKYYDSTCTERGNGWRIREVGLAHAGKRSYIPISDKNGVSYDLQLLNCEEIIKLNSDISLSDLNFIWNKDGTAKTSSSTVWLGKSFRYVSSVNGVHRYKYGGYKDVPLEVIELEFELSFNGNIIE